MTLNCSSVMRLIVPGTTYEGVGTLMRHRQISRTPLAWLCMSGVAVIHGRQLILILLHDSAHLMMPCRCQAQRPTLWSWKHFAGRTASWLTQSWLQKLRSASVTPLHLELSYPVKLRPPTQLCRTAALVHSQRTHLATAPLFFSTASNILWKHRVLLTYRHREKYTSCAVGCMAWLPVFGHRMEWHSKFRDLCGEKWHAGDRPGAAHRAAGGDADGSAVAADTAAGRHRRRGRSHECARAPSQQAF